LQQDKSPQKEDGVDVGALPVKIQVRARRLPNVFSSRTSGCLNDTLTLGHGEKHFIDVCFVFFFGCCRLERRRTPNQR